MKKRMEKLLEADVTADDLQKELFKAIESDEEGYVELLLNVLGVNYENDSIKTPLIHAASLGKTDCVKKLIALGVDVNAVPRPMNQESALERAANGGHLEVVRCLLNTGQVKQAHKNQAFAMASGSEKNGHLECMQALFYHGDSVNMELFEYEYGEFSLTTALGIAVNSSCMDSIDWLLAHGADVNAIDEDDKESILESVIRKKRPDILDKILATGRANLNTLVKDEDEDGEEFEQTLMEYAEEIGSRECLKVLKNYQKKTEDLQKLIDGIGFEKCLEVLQQYQLTQSLDESGEKRSLDCTQDDRDETEEPDRKKQKNKKAAAEDDVASAMEGLGSSDVEGDLGTIGEIYTVEEMRDAWAGI